MAQQTISKCKDFLYTIWFDDEERYERWVRRVELCVGDGGPIRYVTGQLERAPDTGRLHGQVFVQWRQQQRGGRLGTATRLVAGDYHFERRRGTAAEARAYCRKEDTRVIGPFEFGEFSGGQGHRSDLVSVIGAIREGYSRKRLFEEFPGTYVKYHKGLDAVRDVLQAPEQVYHRRDVYLYIGGTGVGKTRFAYASHPGLCRLPAASETSPWFDGYDGQEEVLFDDYGGKSVFCYRFMLQLLDGYPMLVPIKGGFKHWNPKVIVITSNETPEMWYSSVADISHLQRRITHILRFRDDGTRYYEKEPAPPLPTNNQEDNPSLE